MIKQLIKLANHLDKKGLTKEADYLDKLIKKLSNSKTMHGINLDDLKKHLANYPECYKNAVRDLGFIGNYSWANMNMVKGGIKACLKEKGADNKFIFDTINKFFPQVG